MTVVTTHRYKRPPRKRKAVALEVPAVVTRKRVAKAEQVRGTRTRTASATATPANDDRKPAIVTAKPKRRTEGTAMELPASRREPVPVERDGDDYKRMKAAMARRLRGE